MTQRIVILGGGLAGLTLSLQLRSELGESVAITVIERQPHPVPEAAHKVGESTVEIGAHYFARRLGLREHLEKHQLRKYGLRFFFDAGDNHDLERAAELGTSRLLAVPSYQLDRGILENHLGECARRAGIDLIDGASVRAVELAENGDDHGVRFRIDGEEHELHARWVIDAMSRASALKRQLGLAEDNGHGCSAVWFRIAERIDLGRWSRDADWQARCSEMPRWLSTNHLMGPGYWVWLIPLSSGSTSVGIVFDNALHDFDRLRTYEGTLDWLARHQPRCRKAIDECRGELQDFRFLKHFSHGCRQVYSHHRWALTGEAGVFLDPFYSPGSDFIAISNTYITDLVRREMAGDNIARRARHYERMYLSFYDSSLLLYRDQYPLFGHTRAMTLKTVWDYAYYWGVLALIFFGERLTDLDFLVRHGPELAPLRDIHGQLQRLFLAWSKSEPQMAADGLFVDQSRMPLLVDLNRGLTEAEGDPDLDRRMAGNIDLLRRLAAQIRALAPADAAAELDIALEPGDEDLLAGLPERLMHAPDSRAA